MSGVDSKCYFISVVNSGYAVNRIILVITACRWPPLEEISACMKRMVHLSCDIERITS
jgi:hypothetical protein